MTLANSYADFADYVRLGMQQQGANPADRDKIEQTLISMSRVADSIIVKAYPDLPLTQWPESLTIAVCKLTAFEYTAVRGFDVNGPNEIMVIRYKQAMDWLKDVGANKAFLIGVPNQTSATPSAAVTASVYSDPDSGV
jgi:phage gp36-like protein